MIRMLLLLVMAALPLSAVEDFPSRSGQFVVVAAQITPAKGNNTKIGKDLVSSFDISTTIRNETGEAWTAVSFDVDVFQPDGSRIGEGVSPHSFAFQVALGVGEEKTITVNRARAIPAPVEIARLRVALSEDAAKAILVDSGRPIGLLAADTKCAMESEGALSEQGLEARKKLAELIAYKCATTFDSPVHAVEIRRDEKWAQIRIIEGAANGKSGWVPSGQIK